MPYNRPQAPVLAVEIWRFSPVLLSNSRDRDLRPGEGF